MTGWRLGYGVMPRRWSSVDKLMVNSNSCTASFTQRAGIAALQRPAGRLRPHGRRVPPPPRCLLRRASTPSPASAAVNPQGAFYAFPNITGTGMTLQGTRRRLLTEAGVACLSGAAFGEFGEGYLRFSMANSLDHLMEAVERIRAYVATLVA